MYPMIPPELLLRDASSAILKPPNIIHIAAMQKISTPKVILPSVATSILSLLKKIPDPTTIPTIIPMVVNKLYLTFDKIIHPFVFKFNIIINISQKRKKDYFHINKILIKYNIIYISFDLLI